MGAGEEEAPGRHDRSSLHNDGGSAPLLRVPIFSRAPAAYLECQTFPTLERVAAEIVHAVFDKRVACWRRREDGKEGVLPRERELSGAAATKGVAEKVLVVALTLQD